MTDQETLALRQPDWRTAQVALLAITQATQDRPTGLRDPNEFIRQVIRVLPEDIHDGRVRAEASDFLRRGPNGRETLNPDSQRALELASAQQFLVVDRPPLSRDDFMIALGQKLAEEMIAQSVRQR